MGLSLQLLISLDSLADTFLDDLIASVGDDENKGREDVLCFWFRSSDWLAEDVADINAGLRELGDAILLRMDNRLVESVDIALALSARDSQSAERFLPVYRHLERFLPVVTTRRLYVIYPRRASALTEFRRNFTRLLRETSSTQHDLRQIRFLIAPEDEDADGRSWSRTQLESYRMVNLMGDCRAKLDSLLSAQEFPCSDSGYARCVFEREKWREYYLLRTRLDLTERQRITDDAELDSCARQFVRDSLPVENLYRIGYPRLSMGAPRVRPEQGASRPAASLLGLYKEAMVKETSSSARITQSEEPRLTACEESYLQFLINTIDEDSTSLAGVERALYLHTRICQTLDDPGEHRSALHDLVSNATVDVINAFVDCLGSLGVQDGLDQMAESGGAAGLQRKIEQIDSAIRGEDWSDEKLIVRTAIVRLLDTVRRMNEVTERDDRGLQGRSFVDDVLSLQLLGDELDLPIKEALRDLDSRLETVRQEQQARQNEIEKLDADYGPLKKLTKAFTYRKSKRALRDAMQETEGAQQEWSKTTKAFLAALSPYLTLCARLRLVQILLRREIGRMESVGEFLLAFDRAMAQARRATEETLERFTTEPEDADVAISFLDRSDMETLYRGFGEAHISSYIDTLLRGRDQVLSSWGSWAVNGLAKYVDQLDPYSSARFTQVTSLDLPILMSHYFPQHVVPRVRKVAEMAAGRLLPLRESNLASRHYLMILGFPSGTTPQLQENQDEFRYSNPRVSLHESQPAYVDNADPFSLDLTLNLCGFCIEDYLYWGVFDQADNSAAKQTEAV